MLSFLKNIQPTEEFFAFVLNKFSRILKLIDFTP